MNRYILILLVSMPFAAGADEKAPGEEISTSALSLDGQPYTSNNTSIPSNDAFLEVSKIAIGAIIKSHHYNKYDYYDYNEDHNGVYLNINRWSTGTFTNSANKQSLFVTYNPTLYQRQTFMVNMVTGVANGYEDWEHAQGEYLLILGVSAQWAFLKTMLLYDTVTFGMEVPLN